MKLLKGIILVITLLTFLKPSRISDNMDVKPLKATAIPIEISEVSFLLDEFGSYLIFDKNGMEMPEIMALYQDEFLYFENNKPNWGDLDFFVGDLDFYLQVAEVDLNSDGRMDYVVQYPDCAKSGGIRADEGYIDIVLSFKKGLNRMYLDIWQYSISMTQVAIRNTITKGFFDIVITPEVGILNKLYKYDGINYEEQVIANEERIWYDQLLSSTKLQGCTDGKAKFEYILRIWTKNIDEELQFFVAGLFVSANRDGYLKDSRLLACDENGNPMLFSLNDIDTWIDIVFYSECGDAGNCISADLDNRTSDDYNLIFPDELIIVVYEP